MSSSVVVPRRLRRQRLVARYARASTALKTLEYIEIRPASYFTPVECTRTFILTVSSTEHGLLQGSKVEKMNFRQEPIISILYTDRRIVFFTVTNAVPISRTVHGTQRRITNEILATPETVPIIRNESIISIKRTQIEALFSSRKHNNN